MKLPMSFPSKRRYFALAMAFLLSSCLGLFLYEQKKISSDSYAFVKKRFHSNFQEAFAEAQKKNQLVLAFFHAPWCPYSGASIENSFSKKVLKDFLDDFVFLQVDLESVEYIKIKKKYDISGTNRVLFLNSQAEKIAQIYGSRLDDDDFAVLKFFKGLNPLDNSITPSMIKDEVVLEAFVELLIFSSSRFQEENWAFAEQLISSFSQRFPDISVEKLENNLLLKKAQKQGNLYKHKDLILNVTNEPQWILALLNDDKMKEDPQRLQIARDTRRLVRDQIREEKTKKNPDLRNHYKHLLSLNDILGESDKNLWSEFLEFVEDNGNRRSDQVYISHAMTWRGHYSGSLNQYDKLLKMAPESVSLKIRKARVFIRAKRYSEAISLLERVKSETFGENRLKNFLFLSQAHRGVGDHLKADRWLALARQEAEKMYGEYTDNSVWYGRILEEQKKNRDL